MATLTLSPALAVAQAPAQKAATKTAKLAPAGQKVAIRLMGGAQPLQGHVQSTPAGIEDRYRSEGSSLLPNVTPAFDWVRLAQRIPVRIQIDAVPEGVTLIAGRTATVTIEPDAAASQPAHPAQAGL